MKKILLFEPWHLGDVAVALSVIKQYKQNDCEFSLVCNTNWENWALSTKLVTKVFGFSPAWTLPRQLDKYNPLNYPLYQILEFKKNVLNYRPDVIVDLRGDIRAKFFLKLLFGPSIKIVSEKIPEGVNVYQRGQALQHYLKSNPSTNNFTSSLFTGNSLTVFLGASDKNRMVPEEPAIDLITKLHEKGFTVNLILQPSDDLNRMEQIKKERNLANLKLIMGDVVHVSRIIKDSSMVVSTDSGWLHVSFFHGIPTVGLFAFDTIKTWLPPGASCVAPKEVYPAYYRYKRKYQSLQPLALIDTGKVVEAIEQLRTRFRISDPINQECLRSQ
jgi:ADP-heptose:LPS heptosyltransferase